MMRKKVKPPKLFELLLRMISKPEERFSVIGDFEEIFDEMAKEQGFLKALRWYGSQIVKSIPLFFINTTCWRMAMFKNYLIIAFRNMKRQKGYSIINVSGLAIGLACFILIFLWIHDEFSFDRFHENAGALYRVISKIPTSNEITHSARTANAVGPTLVEQFPDIVNYTRYQCFGGTLIEANGKSYLSDFYAVADPSFFEMFSFPFMKGDPKSALTDKFSIVITESMARRFFGEADPMGKILNLQLHREPFKVTGVLKDLPETSHLHFECMIPFIVCKDWFDADPGSWKITQYYTYLMLQKGSKLDDVNEKISNIIKEHDESAIADIYLQPLKDIHLKSNFTGDLDNYKKGDMKTIYIYCITALSILIIACINFMNLSTAQSSRRAKEVGLRKVVGAQKYHLLKQFLGESVLLSIFALLLAIMLVIILLPFFNNLTNKQLVLDLSINLKLMIGIVGITLLTGVISGIYPAFFLSALKPVNALKNSGFRSRRGGLYLRKLLVTSQFTFSVILIAGTLIVYNQLDFIKNKPLGYDSRYIIHPRSYFNNSLKDELLQNPNIISIAQGPSPGLELRGNSSFQWEGKNGNQETTLYPRYVDYSYLETFNMSMKEGRYFSKEFGTDDHSLIINETAARVMGLGNPIGTQVWFERMDFDTGRMTEKTAVIIGVIKDFHQTSLHNPIEPMIFELNTGHPYISIKIKPEHMPETLAFLEDTWKKHVDYPYSYSFLSDTIENFYDTDHKTGTVFSYFSLLAIFISCLGLLGLAAYTAEQRKKEIGIRKVLGSSIIGITSLLSREFLKNVALSIIIAWPIAWFTMREWLNGFAYRTHIGISVFIISGILALGIAFISVGYQVFKAAVANPVDSLRDE